MAQSLWRNFIFNSDQGENITRDELKIYFDNVVYGLNILKNEDYDVYIQSVDTIVTNLLNININQLNEIIILDHPLIFIFRDLIINLLQEKNIIAINIMNLFTKLYLKIEDDRLPSIHDTVSPQQWYESFAQHIIYCGKTHELRTVFFYQPLLDVLVRHRINGDPSDTASQFLIHTINMHKTRYACEFFDETRPYLDEVVTYFCSSAYIDTFNHLFTRLELSNQSKLDDIDSVLSSFFVPGGQFNRREGKQKFSKDELSECYRA